MIILIVLAIVFPSTYTANQSSPVIGFRCVTAQFCSWSMTACGTCSSACSKSCVKYACSQRLSFAAVHEAGMQVPMRTLSVFMTCGRRLSNSMWLRQYLVGLSCSEPRLRHASKLPMSLKWPYSKPCGNLPHASRTTRDRRG